MSHIVHTFFPLSKNVTHDFFWRHFFYDYYDWFLHFYFFLKSLEEKKHLKQKKTNKTITMNDEQGEESGDSDDAFLGDPDYEPLTPEDLEISSELLDDLHT